MKKTAEPASASASKPNMWQTLNEARIKSGQPPFSPKKIMEPPNTKSSLATHCQKEYCIRIISNGSPQK